MTHYEQTINVHAETCSTG